MLLCLSSGHSRRYREDVLRSASLPPGSVIQFRYDEKHLGPSVKALVTTEKAVASSVLIVYSDQAMRDRDPELVPCRYATVVSQETLGTTISIRLRLQDYAYSETLSAFNSELVQLSEGLTPRRNQDGKLNGCYFVELNADPKALVRTCDPANWQRLIDQLSGRSDFLAYEAFILIRSISRQSPKVVSANQDGQFQLKPGTRNVMRLYQYHPTQIPKVTHLQVGTPSARIRFVSDSVLTLDSRYDHKEVRFESTLGIDSDESVMTVVQKHSTNDELTLTYAIPFMIPGGWIRAAGYSVLMAPLLAAPHVMSAVLNPTLTSWKLGVFLSVAALSSIAASLVAVFKIRRLL